jgi:2-polyprenyl-3-methyl-5-hydroxy-6-metoxy-1,4-benzoquinol methylase
MAHDGEELNTHYSQQFVEALRPCKPGKWLQDELGRANKIMTREAVVLSRYLDIRGRRLLDFGCGAGASSVVWAKFGAIVTGIEPDAQLAAAARLRVVEDGVQATAHILHVPDTLHLPFAPGSFEICICNAVLEHIPPQQRGGYLREIWRVLEPGGFLYITETPNRLSPYDGHTTQLWGVPWLPLRLARRYGIWRGRIEPDKSEDDLVALGIRGATYFEIASALRGHRFALVRSQGKDEIEGTVDLERPQSAVRRTLKKGYVALFRLLDNTVCRWTGIPVAAFLPDLTLCLQKLPD